MIFEYKLLDEIGKELNTGDRQITLKDLQTLVAKAIRECVEEEDVVSNEEVKMKREWSDSLHTY